MSYFVANLLLALIWIFMTGEVSAINLLMGCFLGYAVLYLLHGWRKKSSYFLKVRQIPGFIGWFSWQLLLCNLRVAHNILTPGHDCHPGVVAIPLEVTTAAEITLLANLITLTPGTLSLDVSDDEKVLYIHAMFIDDPDAVRKEIKEGMERKVMELMR